MIVLRERGKILILNETKGLSEEFVDGVVHSEECSPAVGGRGEILRGELPSGERFVLRRYRRGGAVRHLVKETFLRRGKTRPEQEFEVTERLFRADVSVPEPLFAVVWKGVFTYRGVIATAEVSGKNLLERIAGAQHLAFGVGVQAGKALLQGVFHRDLHPGNVLVRDDDSLVLIDFDKAESVQGSLDEYCDRLNERWKRAVDKLRLNPELGVQFARGLESVVHG